MTVRELDPVETHLAYEALLDLRPHLGPVEEFVDVVNARQRPDGYRLVASFDEDEVACVAGFRRGHCLAWGEFFNIDDLVTLTRFQGRGHAAAVLDWIRHEARRLGCDQLHLDSGSHRHDAHRLYLRSGYRIAGFHFGSEVE